jgi:hypothetical protein
MAVGCADAGKRVPPSENAPATAETVAPFCSVALEAPESWQTTLFANDMHGIDCVPPQGGEVFSLGFSHRAWWMQLDIARRSLTVGKAHAFDDQAALLALDCWEWDGDVTVDEDDAAGWAVRIDARCRDDAQKAVVGAFSGEL